MEISANTSQSFVTTQRSADRSREDLKAEQPVSQQNTPTPVEDKATTAEPVKETSSSEQTENRNNQQITRQESAPEPRQNTSIDESIGGQIDVRA